MAGRIVVRVASRRSYDYGGLAADEEGTVLLADRIDVSSFDKVDLLVRIHGLEFGTPSGQNPSDAEIKVMVLSDGNAPEAAGQGPFGFFAVIGEFSLAPLTAASGDLKIVQFAGALGSMLMIVLVFKQDTAEALALNAELSVDLVLKGAGACHGCSTAPRAKDGCACEGRSAARPAC